MKRSIPIWAKEDQPYDKRVQSIMDQDPNGAHPGIPHYTKAIETWKKLGPLNIAELQKKKLIQPVNKEREIYHEEKFYWIGQRDEKNRWCGLGKFDGSYIYEGEYEKDKFNGYGRIIWTDGRYYEGQWQNDMYCGYGTEVKTDGSKKEGYWVNWKYVGKTKPDPRDHGAS